MVRSRLLFPALMIAAIAVAAGCGGGGGAAPFVSPAPTATPTPNPGPTNVPVPSSSPSNVFLSTGTTGTVYDLDFTIPPETIGSVTTMSAVLQTTLPANVNAPQSRSQARRLQPVKPLASMYQGLAYLVVSTTADAAFSATPSFQYTVPSGSIPAGDNAYVLFWDPGVGPINGWIPLLQGTVNGNTVSFPGTKSGTKFLAGTQYVFALVHTAQKPATATPAPPPTPTPTSPGSAPAYCAAYATATPYIPPATPGATPVPSNTPSAPYSPQPVYFTDKSSTGAQVVFYVITGTDPNAKGSTQTYYLQANGKWAPFTLGATAPPLPVACFPGSSNQGTSGLTFSLPPPPNVNESANLYIAYASPAPSGPPNPLEFYGQSNGGNAGPDLFTGARFADLNYTYPSTPWDYVEYTLPFGVTDITQVDKVGLPIQMTQAGSQTIGFAPGQYEKLVGDFENYSDPNYKKLIIAGTLQGQPVMARILSPGKGLNFGFPADWWYNNTYQTNNAFGRGYVGYLMQQYQTTPAFFTLNKVEKFTASDTYCVSSDGVANFTFYPSAGPCSTPLPGSPAYVLPVNSYFEGTINGSGNPVLTNNVCDSALFEMPYGSAFPKFADLRAFYLWKALAIDISRGVALQPQTHPIGGWDTGPANPLPFSSYAKDSVYNGYWYLVHKEMINNRTYALQYDEPGGLAPTITSNPKIPLQITVQHIPQPPAGVIPPDPSARPTPPALACPTQ